MWILNSADPASSSALRRGERSSCPKISGERYNSRYYPLGALTAEWKRGRSALALYGKSGDLGDPGI